MPFGHVGSFRPGDTFRNRLDLSASGLHRPRRTGIAGSQHTGAESIVLADQYEDDAFTEEEIVYAGHGGRDSKTGHQTADQVPESRNLALLKSVETGLPVRVLRRVPAEAPGSANVYRYEGLYRVVGADFRPGRSGFRVYLFRLRPLVSGGL